MKGFFIQKNVPDPDNQTIMRERVCVFTLLVSGMDINKVEIARPTDSHTVQFNGVLGKSCTNAEELLGHDLG